MKLVLRRVRLAFAQSMWEPKQINGKGDPKCGANFIIAAGDAVNMNETVKVIQAVAVEKWKDQANTTLQMLKAKGDLCLHDGMTKAKYDGFAGNFFVSASNKARPAIVAKRRFNGKAIGLDQAGNTYIDGVRTDVGFPVKVPYAGCYVNASLDVWAQQNSYGQRVNATLLAIQFEDDGAAFSGGEGFDEADFAYGEDQTSAASDDFFSGGFGAPAAAPAPAPAQAGGFFSMPPAAGSGGGFFG